MKDLRELDALRCREPWVMKYYGSFGDGTGGVFRVPCSATSRVLAVIAASGGGWDHVSVSLPNRTPSWREMDYIKRLFFKDDEWAMQLHAPPSEHINVHEYCLHLWRPTEAQMPTPPREFVA